MPVKILNQHAPAEIGRFIIGEVNRFQQLLTTVDGVECYLRATRTLHLAGVVTCIPTHACWVEGLAPYVDVEEDGTVRRIVGGVFHPAAALALHRFHELVGKGVAMQGMEL